MIRIFYNPNELELIFSVASLLLAKSHEEGIFFMPVATDKLIKSGPDQMNLFDLDFEDEEDEEDEEFLTEASTGQEDKIILLNIYPNNKQEKIDIINFYDRYEKQIMLWLSNRPWDEEILNYFGKNNSKIVVNPEKNCGQILKQLGYPVPDFWLKAENAIINIDMRNHLASRYIRAMLVNKTIGVNSARQSDLELSLFVAAVNELITAQENEAITQLSELFLDMIKEANWAKKHFSVENPIFRQAKKMGRPVGYLALDEIDDYFNIEDVLNYGTKKFPWLCVIEFSLNGRSRLALGSQKLPIKQIMEDYSNLNLSTYEVMKLINAELKIKRDCK